MQSFCVFIFCCVFCGVTLANSIQTTTAAPTKSKREDFPQQILKDFKTKKEKLACILTLLKNALTDDQDNQAEDIPESVLTSLNNILEEKKEDFESLTNETEPDKTYHKIITKITTALKQKDPNQNIEVPNMIPIFKPRHSPKKESNCESLFKPLANPKPITFVPEKIVQTNMNALPNQLFNIPCQKAVDILDMGVKEVKKPDKTVNLTPAKAVEAPVTLSVNCADSDDTVAMLFKPKAISLMQLYGNLLKKLTITVLVPYYMSQLGQK